MNLQLTNQEANTLEDVLGSVLSDLSFQIADSDAAMRRQLRSRKATLERLLGRLGDFETEN